MRDVVTFGESMVQFVPTSMGPLRDAAEFQRTVAGAESNVAIGLARLGHSAGWISRVGDDEFGACVKKAIRTEGVDISQVVDDEAAPTGIYFKERRRSQETRVFYYRKGSAASRMSTEDLDEAYIAGAIWIHLTGITPALSASCKQMVWDALRMAAEGDVRVSFDPNVREQLWELGEAREVLRKVIPHTDLLLTGREEAQFLSGTNSPEEAAQFFCNMGPAQVVIRLDEEGALGRDSQARVVRQPAIPVEVVETVGAGDAFNAGFLSGQLRGWDLSDCLQLGNILGGLATTTFGDVEGLPTWEEVQLYLEDPGALSE